MATGKATTIFDAIDKFSRPVKAMSAASSRFANSTQANFARAGRATQAFGNSADGLFNKVVNLRSLLIGGAIGMAAKQMFDLAKSAAATGDEIGKTSRQIGISAEGLQELRYVAERQGITQETMTSSLLKLNKTVGEAKAGQGTLVTALKASNPQLLKQLKAVENTDQAFDIMVEAINKAPNQFEKTRLATTAFGRAGVDMLKVMEAGGTGIADLRKEANKLGLVLSTESTQAAEKFADSQLNMERSMEAVKLRIGTALMPEVEKIMNRVTEWTSANKALIDVKVKGFVTSLANGLSWLSKNASKVIFTIKLVVGLLLALKAAALISKTVLVGLKVATFAYNVALGIMGALSGKASIGIGSSTVAMAAYKTALFVATGAQWLLNAALTANPIGLTIAAIAALIALIVVIVKKYDDWGASITLLLGPIGTLINIVMGIAKHWEQIKQSFSEGGFIEGIKTLGKVLIDSVLYPIQQILELASNIPGMSWAKDAAASIGEFRSGLDLTANQPQLANPTASEGEQTRTLLERTNNANVNLNINDPNNRTTATTDDSFVKINTTPTFNFGM